MRWRSTTEVLANVPFSPRAPENLYFSEEQQAWILSRHRDVLAALRSADLSQARPPKADADPSVKPDREKSCFAEANGWTHSEAFTALVNSHTSKRQIEITGLASGLLKSLPRDRPIDLVSQFIRPWCLASAIALTGADPAHAERLAQLVKCLSESDAAPHDTNLKSRAKEASRELDCYLPGPSSSHAKSMFLGVAQTLQYFLGSAWAALLQHPTEAKQLQKHPRWVPRATEELLRYAGPVHTLFRRANRDMEICGTNLKWGDRLILRLQSANRDPQQFPEPDRLDFTRDVAGHLALSSGPYYCVGAPLVRMMTAIATRAILGRYSEPRLSNPVRWYCGTMVMWPCSLAVLLGNSP
jgi:cytochrome P450